MSKYQAYVDRVTSNGINNSFQEDMSSSSKRQAYENLLTSPTLTSVDEMELVEQSDKTYELKLKESKPSIVSDIDSFYKRVVLFPPDDGVRLGTYISHQGKTFLTTKIKGNEIYPEAEIEFCNYELLIKGKSEKIYVGEDVFNKPEYEYITTPDYTLPCVATSKIYSTLDNSQIPLPVGALYLYIPYHEEIDIPVNLKFMVHGNQYTATTVEKIGLIKDKNGEWHGCLEIRGQREVKK
jgi:hypothetical protein